MFDLREIEMFKDALKIEELDLKSRCPNKYKVITTKGEYFVKIEDDEYSSKDLEKARFLYKTYEDLGIPVIPLIDIIVKDNKTIWFFPFFKGKTLLQTDFSREEYQRYGSLVAKDIKKLNQINPGNLFGILDLSEHFEKRKGQILEIMESKEALKIFDSLKWHELLNIYQSLYDKIKTDKVFLNHNDIKLPNILIDDNKDYYFIDLDPFDLTIIGYNIGYSISAFLFSNDKEKEKYFLRSFITEIDANKKLFEQMYYFLISDFLNKFPKYIEMYQKESKYIEKLLFNYDNYLSKELYD